MPPATAESIPLSGTVGIGVRLFPWFRPRPLTLQGYHVGRPPDAAFAEAKLAPPHFLFPSKPHWVSPSDFFLPTVVNLSLSRFPLPLTLYGVVEVAFTPLWFLMLRLDADRPLFCGVIVPSKGKVFTPSGGKPDPPRRFFTIRCS